MSSLGLRVGACLLLCDHTQGLLEAIFDIWCALFQISHCDAKHIRGLVTSKPSLATLSVCFSATSMKVSFSATCLALFRTRSTADLLLRLLEMSL